MKKTKLSPREVRLQREQEKKDKFRAQEAEKAEREKLLEAQREAERIRAEKDKRLAAEQAEVEKAREKAAAEGQKRKSKAKAAGVKSVFCMDGGEMVLTAFGRGNEAIPNKKVSGNEITDLSSADLFDADFEDEKRRRFAISSGRMTAKRDNPLAGKQASPNSVGRDMICAKDALEKRYFGRTFEDNLHIQIIYSILDIQKILAVHVNNITFMLNNVVPMEAVRPKLKQLTLPNGKNINADKPFDFIGYQSVQNTYEEFTDARKLWKDDNAAENIAIARTVFGEFVSSHRLRYFGRAFYKSAVPDKKPKDLTEQEKKDAYYALCLMGTLRQATAHGEESKIRKIFSMESNSGPAWQEAREMLTRTYSTAVTEINSGFLKKSENEKIITVFFRVFHADTAEQKTEIVRNYYDFSIKKAQKNLGFSLKKVRESLLDLPGAERCRDKEFDQVRSKLYTILDFILYDHYLKDSALHRDDPEQSEQFLLVSKLRSTLYEAEKDVLYAGEAKRLQSEIIPLLNSAVLPMMNGDRFKALTPDQEISEKMLEGECIRPDNSSCFCSLLYLMTCFLDGKEVNDLLTQMLSKFENIESLLSVLRSLSGEASAGFCESYALFEQSGEIAAQIRTVLNFPRPRLSDLTVTSRMNLDAAAILGVPENFSVKFSENRGLWNFISYNVTKSRRFLYIIKYNDPKRLHALAQNKKAVNLVMKEIPDAQITRYYNACAGTDEPYSDKMRPWLGSMIRGMTFDVLKDADRYQTAKDQERDQEMERKKAAVRLYLTVLYLLTKNLIYVNSRYYLAFHCLERDSYLLQEHLPEEMKISRNKGKKIHVDVSSDYAVLTRLFTSNSGTAVRRLNSRASSELAVVLRQADSSCIRAFRNGVEHLNVIRDADWLICEAGDIRSYYQLYHYMMQRYLKNSEPAEEQFRFSEKTHEYLLCAERYHTPSRDFIKALCIAFGYNLARYRNLSEEALFDRNRPPAPASPASVLQPLSGTAD